MFIDVHCHVYGEKLDDLISHARKNKVGVIVNSGANVRANRKTLKIAEKFPEFKATMGLYPSDALKMDSKKIDSEIKFIEKNKDKIVGISEIGMDFKNAGNHAKQEKYFRKFISLAMKLDKPVVVHSRKAELECIEILESMKVKKVVMHCFSGKLKLVSRIIENGWMLSIPTSVKNSEHFQRVVEMTPVEQLLCETDSPYLHPDREFPNMPGNVIESYKAIAKIKKLGLKDVEKQIEKNFKRFFG